MEFLVKTVIRNVKARGVAASERRVHLFYPISKRDLGFTSRFLGHRFSRHALQNLADFEESLYFLKAKGSNSGFFVGSLGDNAFGVEIKEYLVNRCLGDAQFL